LNSDGNFGQTRKRAAEAVGPLWRGAASHASEASLDIVLILKIGIARGFNGGKAVNRIWNARGGSCAVLREGAG